MIQRVRFFIHYRWVQYSIIINIFQNNILFFIINMFTTGQHCCWGDKTQRLLYDKALLYAEELKKYITNRLGGKDEIRLCLLGDWGNYDAAKGKQLAVAKLINEIHQKNPFDAVLSPGDHNYSDGQLWKNMEHVQKQLSCYGLLDVPFLAAPGNHEFQHVYKDEQNKKIEDTCIIIAQINYTYEQMKNSDNFKKPINVPIMAAPASYWACDVDLQDRTIKFIMLDTTDFVGSGATLDAGNQVFLTEENILTPFIRSFHDDEKINENNLKMTDYFDYDILIGKLEKLGYLDTFNEHNIKLAMMALKSLKKIINKNKSDIDLQKFIANGYLFTRQYVWLQMELEKVKDKEKCTIVLVGHHPFAQFRLNEPIIFFDTSGKSGMKMLMEIIHEYNNNSKHTNNKIKLCVMSHAHNLQYFKNGEVDVCIVGSGGGGKLDTDIIGTKNIQNTLYNIKNAFAITRYGFCECTIDVDGKVTLVFKSISGNDEFLTNYDKPYANKLFTLKQYNNIKGRFYPSNINEFPDEIKLPNINTVGNVGGVKQLIAEAQRISTFEIKDFSEPSKVVGQNMAGGQHKNNFYIKYMKYKKKYQYIRHKHTNF